MYILLRGTFFHLTIVRRWNRPIAAIALLLLTFVCLGLPVWVVVEILIPKITYVVHNSSQLIEKATLMLNQVRQRFPDINISDQQIQTWLRQAIAYIPGVLGTTAAIITNLLTAFFVVYFMFMGGQEMEYKMAELLPLKPENKDSIWLETHRLIKSNAIGIPILAFLQAIVAIIGYWIFGVNEFIIWGLMTGICSLLPVIGTMVVWIPIAVYLFAIGNTGQAIGLTLYSAIVISNIDNVLRFTILKKVGNVHPLITVFGVIVGLQLFGMMGLIFGPLFISYFILMIKVYRAEFATENIIIRQ
jgi:predicted PurR-regulated permease PerM